MIYCGEPLKKSVLCVFQTSLVAIHSCNPPMPGIGGFVETSGTRTKNIDSGANVQRVRATDSATTRLLATTKDYLSPFWQPCEPSIALLGNSPSAPAIYSLLRSMWPLWTALIWSVRHMDRALSTFAKFETYFALTTNSPRPSFFMRLFFLRCAFSCLNSSSFFFFSWYWIQPMLGKQMLAQKFGFNKCIPVRKCSALPRHQV